MTARDDIHARIHGPGYCDPPCGLCVEVADLLDEYAHELAEQLRAEVCCVPDCVCAKYSADLIDLKVKP